MNRLAGKVALVAGAGRGIGRAIAKLYAEEGAKVAVPSLTAANVEQVVREIENRGGTAIGISCDIGDSAQNDAAVATVISAFGQLDVLVNNAFESSSLCCSRCTSPVARVNASSASFGTGDFRSARLRVAP